MEVINIITPASATWIIMVADYYEYLYISELKVSIANVPLVKIIIDLQGFNLL